MKIKSLILAMAACAGLFCACSNEEIANDINSGNAQNPERNAFASFSFVMPGSTGATGRANPTGGAGGDGSLEGTVEENAVSTVKILLFKDDVLTQVTPLNRTDFTPAQVGNVTVYTTKNDIAVAPATYKIYAIVNPTSSFNVIEGTTTLGAFQDAFEAVAIRTGEYCTDGKFMMTNADEIVETIVLPTNTEGKAKEISINVERIAAKVTFTTKEGKENNAYDINDENGKVGTVTFDAYKIINTRNSAYNLRRVGDGSTTPTIGGKETGSNYVIENKWSIKSEWNENAFNTNYSRKHNTYVAFRHLNTGTQTLAYCLENTMPALQQMNGYSTGVIFRAKIAIDADHVTGTVVEGNLYKYAGKYYAGLADLTKALNPNWNIGSNSTDGLNNDVLGIIAGKGEMTVQEYLKSINSNTEVLKGFGVDYFMGGFCYYKSWLRHANNNDDAVSGIMEFAIVRNNIYQLTINSVASVGDTTSGTPGEDPNKPGEPDVDPENPNPEIPGVVVPDPEPTDPVFPIDPTDPDEDADTYLNVTIKVLDWTVRKNNIDL